MKNIYLIVGPSGSGKTMVANRLEEKYRLKQVLSYTERPPRFEGEGGHTFVTPEEFDKLKNLCAYTVFDGHRYGVPAEMVEVSDIYVIDPAGVAYMKEHYSGKKGVKVIGLFAAEEVCKRRMRARGDSKEAINERLAHDRTAFAPAHRIASNPKTYALYGLKECCDVVFRNNFASVKGLEDEIPDLVYQYIKRQERV